MFDFHKTMKDVQKMFHNGDISGATQELKKHETDVTRIYTALNQMKPYLDAIHGDMQNIEATIGALSLEHKETPVNGKTFDQWMENFEKNYEQMHHLVMELKLHTKLVE